MKSWFLTPFRQADDLDSGRTTGCTVHGCSHTSNVCTISDIMIKWRTKVVSVSVLPFVCNYIFIEYYSANETAAFGSVSNTVAKNMSS